MVDLNSEFVWEKQTENQVAVVLGFYMDRVYQDCTLLHVDADGFFAGVEQALNPELRGRPVVTGSERGIIAAASYEAKALGVKRGLQLHEARALAPELVVVPSDYEAYSLYSQKMFAILRRFTPNVEEYSIDEAFADLSGCGLVLNMALEEVAARLRNIVVQELGLTVSVGISLTKTLAKLCSKFRKPNGQTILRAEHVGIMLRRTPIEKVWGIGPSSSAKLKRVGVHTAAEFVALDGGKVRDLLHKPGYESWLELQGRQIFKLELEPKLRYESMMKGHTFAPPSSNRNFIQAEALKNCAAVLAKLRRHNHLAKVIGLVLRRKDYSSVSAATEMPWLSAHDCEMVPLVSGMFDSIFNPNEIYRSTMIWLGGLVPEIGRQMDLFEDTPQRNSYTMLDKAVDTLNTRYGQGTLKPGILLELEHKPVHARDESPERHKILIKGETQRRLAIPRLTLSNPV